MTAVKAPSPSPVPLSLAWMAYWAVAGAILITQYSSSNQLLLTDWTCSLTAWYMYFIYSLLSSLQVSYIDIFLFYFVTQWVIHVITGLEPRGHINKDNGSLSHNPSVANSSPGRELMNSSLMYNWFQLFMSRTNIHGHSSKALNLDVRIHVARVTTLLDLLIPVFQIHPVKCVQGA